MDMSNSHNAILSGKIMRRVLIFTILFIDYQRYESFSYYDCSFRCFSVKFIQ